MNNRIYTYTYTCDGDKKNKLRQTFDNSIPITARWNVSLSSWRRVREEGDFIPIMIVVEAKNREQIARPTQFFQLIELFEL